MVLYEEEFIPCRSRMTLIASSSSRVLLPVMCKAGPLPKGTRVFQLLHMSQTWWIRAEIDTSMRIHWMLQACVKSRLNRTQYVTESFLVLCRRRHHDRRWWRVPKSRGSERAGRWLTARTLPGQFQLHEPQLGQVRKSTSVVSPN